MMRPICFYTSLILLLTSGLVAQNPVATAMRTIEWPASATASAFVDQEVGWSAFSKQYYCVSNWNVTGFSIGYTSGIGQSAALVCRDGIPGFSWYHLYLSHYRQFKKISGMLQLRFSLIDLNNQPMVFRLGGNILTQLSMSQSLMLQVSIYDFPGWILPAAPIARGDPSMQFLLFHEPGRLISLVAGFQVSRSQFGPVTAGIRVNFNEQIGLTGLFDILPFGITLGITWKIKGYLFNGWMEHRNGIGLTPMMEVGR